MDLPFVVDSMLGMLDLTLMKSCLQFITGMSAQIILFEPDEVLQDLRLKADFQIGPHPVTGKSIVARRVRKILPFR